MDATDRIQKINAMTQELKNFGFFEDSNTAMEGAKNIYLSSDDQQHSSVFSAEENAMQELTNSFRRFKDMSNNQMLEMQKTISTLQSQIIQLSQTVSALQSRPTSTPQVESSPSRETLSPQNSVSSNANTESQTQKEEKPYNERQGNFTPEDVRIEDVFYFGQK